MDKGAHTLVIAIGVFCLAAFGFVFHTDLLRIRYQQERIADTLYGISVSQPRMSIKLDRESDAAINDTFPSIVGKCRPLKKGEKPKVGQCYGGPVTIVPIPAKDLSECDSIPNNQDRHVTCIERFK